MFNLFAGFHRTVRPESFYDNASKRAKSKQRYGAWLRYGGVSRINIDRNTASVVQ